MGPRRGTAARLANTVSRAAPPQEYMQQQASVPFEGTLPPGEQTIEEREFAKDVANAVTIIGSAYNMELKFGANLPRLIGGLRCSRGEGKDPEWFNFVVFGELAERVSREIQRGQQVQLIGRLSAREFETPEGTKRSLQNIIVNKLFKIKSRFPLPGHTNSLDQQQGSADLWSQPQQVLQQQPPLQTQYADPGFPAAQPGTGFTQPAAPPPAQPQGQATMPSAEAKWNDLFGNYNSWYDNRTNKRNPKAPDFKHKSTGEALWLNSRDTPLWVKDDMHTLGSPQQSNTESFSPNF